MGGCPIPHWINPMTILCVVYTWVFLTVSCSFFRYIEEMVPSHPCLKLISNCEQKLSSHTSRRLITMEKVKKFENRDQSSHLPNDHSLLYQGHNSFREKYFSGVTKRIAKEEKSSQEWKLRFWQWRKNKDLIEKTSGCELLSMIRKTCTVLSDFM